jgi:hypothetical protein
MSSKENSLIWEKYLAEKVQLRNLRGTNQGKIFGPMSYEVIKDDFVIGNISWSGDSWAYMPHQTKRWHWDNSLRSQEKVANRLMQLVMGINVEMEHTTNPDIAEKIASDHLKENPKYYTILKAKPKL